MKKVLQYLASILMVLFGIALLCAPVHAAEFQPTRFTVVDEGTAGKPDVVLIPGLASSRAVWSAEAAKLAPNFRLHLVQIDGFAGQPAGVNATGTNLLPALVEELHQYISAAKMHPVVMGHSLGGLLTLMLAEKYPGDASKLIIVDALPFYGQVFNPSATVEMIRPQADAMATQMSSMPQAQYDAMQPMVAEQMVGNTDARALVLASGTASDRAVVVEAMHEDLLTDVRANLAAIKVPVLVLFAGYDAASATQAAAYEATVRADYKVVPSATLVKVDDSRHFIMYDQPEKFDAAVQAFLR